MEKDLLRVWKKAEKIFDGTGATYKEYCRQTNQLFITVGPLFTPEHRYAIEKYINNTLKPSSRIGVGVYRS